MIVKYIDGNYITQFPLLNVIKVIKIKNYKIKYCCSGIIIGKNGFQAKKGSIESYRNWQAEVIKYPQELRHTDQGAMKDEQQNRGWSTMQI